MMTSLLACAATLLAAVSAARYARGRSLTKWGGQRHGRWFDVLWTIVIMLVCLGWGLTPSAEWFAAWAVCIAVGVTLGYLSTRGRPTADEHGLNA